jgi:hypothetical protein
LLSPVFIEACASGTDPRAFFHLNLGIQDNNIAYDRRHSSYQAA